MEIHACSDLETALLTPPGRGALAVVGVWGRGAVDLVARCFTPRGSQSLADRPDGAIVFGRWGDPARGEELVVVRHAADWLEIHCHGGFAASDAVISSLKSSLPSRPLSGPPTVETRAPNAPLRSAIPRFPPGAWSLHSAIKIERPAGLAPPSPLRAQIEADARTALARAGGPQAARILCRQLAGGLADELERIASLRAAGDEAAATTAEGRLRRASRVGLRLLEPWRVVVSGPVNAGKSSLVNALAGYARSIVSAEPGTTRDLVITRLVLGGWEIDLIDTAGLREPDEAASATERAGIERALAAAADADLVLKVGPADDVTEMRPFMARISVPAVRPEEPRASSPGRISVAVPRLEVTSKGDLAPGSVAPPGAILTSAHTGAGIDALAAAIVAALLPEETADPTLLTGPVPFTPRQVALLEK